MTAPPIDPPALIAFVDELRQRAVRAIRDEIHARVIALLGERGWLASPG